MKKLLSTLFCLSFVFQASAVTLVIEGELSSGGGPLGVIGDAFTITVSYPTPGTDSTPATDFGSYRFLGSTPGALATYEINGTTLSVPTSEYFDLFVGDNLSSGDKFEMEGFLVAGGADFFNFFFVDPLASVFSSDDLPTSLELSDFTTVGANLFINGDSYFGSVTSVAVVGIPEPSRTVLILLGLSVGFLTRKRW